MHDFQVLMPVPMQARVAQQLEGVVELVRPWTESDPARTIAAAEPTLRALAVGGHFIVDADLMRRCPRLELVANFGVGYNNIDAVWAGQHGIVVTNTPNVLNEEVADTAFGLILATVRQLPAAERHLRAGKWPSGPFPLTATLRDKTLGILGLGRIGKAIARRAEAFGLNVVYHNRRPQPDVPFLYYQNVHALAQASDILLVITPGGAGTDRLVDADVLKALGPEGFLINVARGSVVDEPALIEALGNGTICGAGLDVFLDEPNVPAALMAMDNVVLLPHVGSASHHARESMGQLVADNVLSWQAGRGPVTPVAETPWPPRPA